jgi:hypothetical protein
VISKKTTQAILEVLDEWRLEWGVGKDAVTELLSNLRDVDGNTSFSQSMNLITREWCKHLKDSE